MGGEKRDKGLAGVHKEKNEKRKAKLPQKKHSFVNVALITNIFSAFALQILYLILNTCNFARIIITMVTW